MPQELTPLNAEDWPHRLGEFGVTSSGWDHTMFLGYLSGIERVLPVLEKMAENAASFDELKAAVLVFTKQQQEFLRDVDKRWFENAYSEELLGLPPLGHHDRIPDEVPKCINRNPLL